MLYQSLYSLLSTTASSLPFDNEFHHGRGSDINVFSNNNRQTLIWLSPMVATGSFPNKLNRLFKAYRIELAFYQRDAIDNTNEQTRDILYTADKVLTKYLLDLNDEVVDIDNGVDDVEITNINQEPFIRVTSHILTGFLVTFNITLPDDFNYCP
jgi:hypothetical protein